MTDFTTWELKVNAAVNKMVDNVARGHSISQQRHILKKMVAESSAALATLNGNRDARHDLDVKAWQELGAKNG